MPTIHAVSVIAAPGDTWGIAGPDFLKFYAITAAVLVVGALIFRAASGGGDGQANQGITPGRVAYLRGGAALAVTSSIAGLRAAGALAAPEKGVLATAGPYPSGASRLDWAVYDAASRQVRQRDLLADPGVASALTELRDALFAAGWLRTPAERARLRLAGFLVLLLAALGVARIVAGISNDRPVGYLVLLTIGVVIAGALLLIVKERSRAGSRAIAEAMRTSRHLAPTNAPAWSTYGLTGAAMGVAVFGAAALWSADPAFAEQAEIQRQLGASGSGGGSGSGTSCGGGSSSSCSGGSSCGGGGCGGGGCGG
ncbi:TIGR04222 domain-containing membrane protein [Luedemannella flava]